MSATISVSEARATLPDMVDRVQAGEEITITRHGVPVAVLVSPGALRPRRATTAFELASRIGAELEAALQRPLRAASDSTVSTSTVERWVAELGAERRSR
jgi:prevent-host-death family protein